MKNQRYTIKKYVDSVRLQNNDNSVDCCLKASSDNFYYCASSCAAFEIIDSKTVRLHCCGRLIILESEEPK
jgi:hypothetical protein